MVMLVVWLLKGILWASLCPTVSTETEKHEGGWGKRRVSLSPAGRRERVMV
jgi:hypothetical protein